MAGSGFSMCHMRLSLQCSSVVVLVFCEWQGVVFQRVTRRSQPDVLSVPIRQQQQLWLADQPGLIGQP